MEDGVTNMKRRFLSFLFSISLMVSFVFPFFALPSEVMAKDNEYCPTANEIVDYINVGWTLGGSLDAYDVGVTDVDSFETCWGNPTITEELIAAVKERGFNTIRIPVTWAQHIDEAGNVDDLWMARVKEVVDYAIDSNLVIILNMQNDGGLEDVEVSWLHANPFNYQRNKDRFAKVWNEIAYEFKDYSYRLIFECFNELFDASDNIDEPSNEESYNAVTSYTQTFVDTIRASGGKNEDRNLIITTYGGSNEDNVLNNYVIPNDTSENHLIVSAHVHSPRTFCSLEESARAALYRYDKQVTMVIINRLMRFSLSNNIPVVIGDMGAEWKNNEDQLGEYASYLVTEARENGIKVIWWDDGRYGVGENLGGYAILNRETLEWRDYVVDALLRNTTSIPLQFTLPIKPLEKDTFIIREYLLLGGLCLPMVFCCYSIVSMRKKIEDKTHK